jgi:hypothetical protein
MAFNILETAAIIETLENFIERRRPPVELRNKVDLSYKIENQSIIIFEKRAIWNNPEKYIESPVAKTTFIREKGHWKIFWIRANLKWYRYDPKSTVKKLEQFITTVDQDECGCFWG